MYYPGRKIFCQDNFLDSLKDKTLFWLVRSKVNRGDNESV